MLLQLHMKVFKGSLYLCPLLSDLTLVLLHRVLFMPPFPLRAGGGETEKSLKSYLTPVLSSRPLH